MVIDFPAPMSDGEKREILKDHFEQIEFMKYEQSCKEYHDQVDALDGEGLDQEYADKIR